MVLARPYSADPTERPARRDRVLLIEDDPEYLRLIRLRLTHDSDPFEVETAQTLAEGLSRMRAGGIDVALIDLGLGDSQGLGTFLQLRGQSPDLPIVILSGDDQDGLALEAIQQGAQDYLLKGQLDGRVLSRVLRYAIERHEIHKKLHVTTDELRLVNTRLERLALLDPLTELYNRRGLQQSLTRELRAVERGEDPPVVLLVDLDDFKKVNDSLGHAVGDVVLKETARKLQDCLRTTDYLARIGGDEFMILLPKTRTGEALRIAERIRLSICGLPIHSASGQPVRVSASIGMILVSEGTPSIDELLSRSHLVLRRSKRMGKNRVSFHVGSAEGSLESHEDFADAARPWFLRTVKQPIVHLSEKYEIGYEMLSRCSAVGFEQPDDLFRYCMEKNMLTLMDHRCLRNCLDAAASLPKQLRRHVNLFPSTILDVPAEHLLAPFGEADRRASCCIEISEQQIIGDPSYLVDSVRLFKRAGILVAIDDVGFGRSCVESLVLLEPDIIKVDKRFVVGIHHDRARRQALRRMLRVAEALAAEVIAEGIESQGDMDVLMDLGVLYGQGYHLGRPA